MSHWWQQIPQYQLRSAPECSFHQAPEKIIVWKFVLVMDIYRGRLSYMEYMKEDSEEHLPDCSSSAMLRQLGFVKKT
jgi:hypothetical protein